MSAESRGKIYALTHPVTAEVRYIGLTVMALQKRWKDHKRRALKHEFSYHVYCWWRSVREDSGLDPKVFLVADDIPEDQLDEREIWWISEFRDAGYDLTNHTDGGETPPPAFLNHEFSDEWRQEASERMKRQWADPEYRRLRREGIMDAIGGDKHHHAGGLPQEVKEKKSKAMKRYWEENREEALEKLLPERTEEWRQKIAESKKGQRAASKITMEDAEEIRRRYEEEDETQSEISEDYPIDGKTISKIVNYRTWIPDDMSEAEVEEKRNSRDYPARGGSKLDYGQVKEIRNRYEETDETFKAISKDYPVCPNMISRIVREKVWKPEDYE